MTLEAIVFDFDGVIADSEPLHLRAFQQALADAGVDLTADEYYGQYLGYDDVGMLQALARDRGIAMDGQRLSDLIVHKGDCLQALLNGGSVLFPGARDFIQEAAAAVPIAIASGALRHEIDEIIESAGLAHLFKTIVASGDTPQSKPSPQPYQLAFSRLREAAGGNLNPRRCVVIEDSRWGIESARGAGLRCVGVTTSYPAHELPGAELVVGGLRELTIPMLEKLVSNA